MAVSMTQGLQRPAMQPQLVPLPSSLFAVAQELVAYAWRVLLTEVGQGAFSICNAKEDEITERLHMIMGELYALPYDMVTGMAQLSAPVRDAKVRNYNGVHLDKQPDLSFLPLRGYVACSNAVTCAVFVECKPIDSFHPVPSVYCRDGLVRFVNGDYAWSVDRALMVGYVRNVCHLPNGLQSALNKGTMPGDMALVGTHLQHQQPTSYGDAVCQSAHQRKFALKGSTQPVGLIYVNHLWLHPQEPCKHTRCKT